MTATSEDTLAAKHRALWALGDYTTVATEVVAPLGPLLIGAAGVTAGDRVLDVAAGAGNVAIAAALVGADAVASDLTPELLERGKEIAEATGVTLRWDEANAEALPYEDGEFDAVLSCVGVMFAPHHQLAADELVRVCKPGGTIAVISWTPAGFIGQMFAAMKSFVPAPPAGASPPPLWGDDGYVRTLLGDRVSDLRTERRMLTVDRFATGVAFRDYFKTYYGPTIVAFRSITDSARVAELDAALAELGDRYLAGATTMNWEYLLLTCRAGR